MGGASLRRRRFRVMGTAAEITLVGEANGRALTDTVRELRRLERRWSRFVDDSEVDRINRLAGRPVEVSDDTVLLVELALLGWERTGGRFNPLLLGSMRSIGYTDDFELVRLGQAAASPGVERSDPAACRSVVVDRVRRSVTIPAGHGFDPGGIGKGLAADLVAARLKHAAGVVGGCVNVGGDLRVWGCGPSGGGWRVGGIDRTVETTDVGIATSSRRRRTWEFGGRRVHHLIDAATARPSVTDVKSATVIAPFAWWAEVHATAAATSSADRACAELVASGLEGLVTGADDRLYATEGFGSAA